MKTKENKGITLIALVLTIIVLLILTGISISMLSGENGILNRAQEAKEKTEIASQTEKVRLAVLATYTQGNQSTLDEEILKNELNKQFKNIKTEKNNDGSFYVTLENGQEYYIDESGNIYDNVTVINTADELKKFRDKVNSGNTFENSYIYLKTDINLDINEIWVPIGVYDQNATSSRDGIKSSENKPFSGIFDGKNHTINGINIDSSKKAQGLFSFVKNATIENINIGPNNNFTFGDTYGAGIVAITIGKGYVKNCKNYADMSNGNSAIAGAVIDTITVENCINYGNLNNVNGGIVGSSNGTDWTEYSNTHCSIINCGNYGEILKSRDTHYLGRYCRLF